MMREILFRGKRTDNGEWVEGYLIHDEFCNTFIPYIGYLCGDDVDVADVVPKTVGQFTGLTDKNDKMIFEGDVVQYYGTYALEIFIEKGHTKIRWFDTVTNSEEKDMFYGYDADAYGECEIIGNIHDNPELLERSVNDGNL